MKLSNLERTTVPAEKIRGYLLNDAHPHGRPKAIFFRRFGFEAAAWEVLAAALLRHAAEHDVARVVASPFGTRFVVEGIMATPDGRTPGVRSVWFIEMGEDAPRFVTAYPLEVRE